MTTLSERSNSPDAERPPTLLTRLLDRFSGYDFFISYAHADAAGYAEQLVEGLRSRRFRSFLDKQVYVAGDELNGATLRRVQASSKLVVIVGEQALASHWVLQEVETAIRAGRPVIAIDLIGELGQRQAGSRLAEVLRDRIHIREPGGSAARTPSASTLESLTRSFQATRREVRQLRLALGAALVLGLLAVFAFWQKNLADDRARQYKDFCDGVVQMIKDGNGKIEKLGENSEFGRLIADVTDTLAQLPKPENDPAWSCTPAGS